MEDGITIGRGARVRIAHITMLLLVHLAGQFRRLCKAVMVIEEEEAGSCRMTGWMMAIAPPLEWWEEGL